MGFYQDFDVLRVVIFFFLRKNKSFFKVMADKLLNFSEPIDVPLLEEVLQIVYTCANEKEVSFKMNEKKIRMNR